MILKAVSWLFKQLLEHYKISSFIIKTAVFDYFRGPYTRLFWETLQFQLSHILFT